jgi:hypothetical protein
LYYLNWFDVQQFVGIEKEREREREREREKEKEKEREKERERERSGSRWGKICTLNQFPF